MAGWRVAFAVGNEDIIHAINAFQDHVFVSMMADFNKPPPLPYKVMTVIFNP